VVSAGKRAGGEVVIVVFEQDPAYVAPMPTAIFQAGQSLHDSFTDQMMSSTQISALGVLSVISKANLHISFPRIRDVCRGITTELTLPAKFGDGITLHGWKYIAKAHP